MAIVRLSQLLAKAPAAQLRITSISMDLYESMGWVMVEGEILAGKEGDPVTTITIPVMATDKEILSLFSVTKTATSRTSRRVRK